MISKLRWPSSVRRVDLWFILIPALIWALGPGMGRSRLVELRCTRQPQTCTPESIFWLDRTMLGTELPWADRASYLTQNSSGAAAIAVPALLHSSLAIAGRISPQGALAALGTDLILWGQTVAWNGMLTESARLIAQRPRPFVYKAPATEGADPANYTSFFSGHTSFTAASTMALFLILLARQAPTALLMLSALAVPGLTLSTALFRVLAGRHFITDTVVGALCGILVALTVAYLHKTKAPARK